MPAKTLLSLLTYFIAAIWLVNGLFCKILSLTPRHEQIISAILGEKHSRLFTILIGSGEILIAAWILSGKNSRLNAITQIIIIATMNLIEFFLVPELLLWGRMNLFFALCLVAVIYINEFYLRKRSTAHY